MTFMTDIYHGEPLVVDAVYGNMKLFLRPFIVSCTILDTRALYSQETALGGLYEVRGVSG